MSADYDPLVLQLEVNKMVSVLRGKPSAIAEIAVKTQWALEQDLADHKKEKLILLKRAEAAEARVSELQAALTAAINMNIDANAKVAALTAALQAEIERLREALEKIRGVAGNRANPEADKAVIIGIVNDALKGGEG